MPGSPETSNRRVAVNRKARRDYQVIERIEAGLELHGTEVKSLRAGQVSLVGAYARIERGQAYLFNLNISPYEHGNRFNHDPMRVRRLLLHRREIRYLQVQTDQKGLTLVPLSVFFKRGLVKVDLGICRGKGHKDKRETLRRRTADREAERAIARGRRRG